MKLQTFKKGIWKYLLSSFGLQTMILQRPSGVQTTSSKIAAKTLMKYLVRMASFEDKKHEQFVMMVVASLEASTH